MVSIRVWHNNPRGDAYYYRFGSLKAANAHIKTHKTAERSPTIVHMGREYPVSQYTRLNKTHRKHTKKSHSSYSPFGNMMKVSKQRWV